MTMGEDSEHERADRLKRIQLISEHAARVADEAHGPIGARNSDQWTREMLDAELAALAPGQEADR